MNPDVGRGGASASVKALREEAEHGSGTCAPEATLDTPKFLQKPIQSPIQGLGLGLAQGQGTIDKKHNMANVSVPDQSHTDSGSKLHHQHKMATLMLCSSFL